MPRKSQFTATEKYKIVEAGKKKNIDEVCRQHRISKSLYYKWEQQIKEAAIAGLGAMTPKQERKLTKQVNELEEKVQSKDSVIAELTHALLNEKKSMEVH